jgi:hypothetical protein
MCKTEVFMVVKIQVTVFQVATQNTMTCIINSLTDIVQSVTVYYMAGKMLEGDNCPFFPLLISLASYFTYGENYLAQSNKGKYNVFKKIISFSLPFSLIYN